MAAIASRWLRRNASQRRPGSGSWAARFTQREMVRSEMLNPSFSSSPWMRGAPQVGFSATIRKIRSRSSLLNGFLPPTGRVRESQAQYNSKAGPMPADHGLRLDNDQRLLPTRPQAFQRDPEQLIETAQSRARSFGMDSQQLLAQGEVLENEVFSGSKRRVSQPRSDESQNHQKS